MRRAMTAVLAAALLGVSGCPAMVMDPLGRKEALRMSQREYTNRIRWGDIERASEMVDPAMRKEFLSYVPAFEMIRITDFEIAKPIFHETEDGEQQVDVSVTYEGYSLATLTEKKIREKQVWYRDGIANLWMVRPEIEGIASAFAVEAN